MSVWRFFDYITADGRNLMKDWYELQDEPVQARFDATLLILAGLDDWEDESVEEFKPLTQNHIGLGEVRFHIEALAMGAKRTHRRRFRPVGIWPTDTEHEFVLICGCEKIGRSLVPHGAFETALLYKVDLKQGRGTISDHI